MYVPIKKEKKREREKRKNPKKEVNSIVYIAFLLFVFSIRGFDEKSNWTFFSEILLILTRIHIT
jgi:L-asparagine transporter-like permease